MVQLRGSVKIVGGPAAVAKQVRPAKKKALANIGEWWHRFRLPRHFKTSAVSEYHFQPRGIRYMRYKAKRQGHQRPLEFGGEMKEEVTREARITSTSKGCRVVMTGPKHLYQYRKDYNQPDKAAELTMVTAAEERTMTEMLKKRVSRAASKAEAPMWFTTKNLY